MESIILYGDKIERNIDGNNLFAQWHGYLEQDIWNLDDDTEHFTRHPLIGAGIFKYFNHPIEIQPLDQFVPGLRSVIPIGLLGGWNVNKLKYIKHWLTHPSRLAAWNDPACQIVIDYSLEGFTEEVFPELWQWIEDNDLHNRILYVSSSYNVEQLYWQWCDKAGVRTNMRTSWYGFFINWINRDREFSAVKSKLQQAQWQQGQARYMCLNRRPHVHRILLLTLLERFDLIKHGGVSMPRNFEDEVDGFDEHAFDIPYQWQWLKDGLNGSIDNLQADFDRMWSRLPLIADTDNFKKNHALDINEEYYTQFPINIVSETFFFSESVFASEKVWKPMLIGQIFLAMAPAFYLQSLRAIGFQTFSPWINEEYDLITDHVERAIELMRVLKSLVKLGNAEFAQLLARCEPAIQHNRQILMDSERINKLIGSQVIPAIESYWATA
jgi:hypothetical protein